MGMHWVWSQMAYYGLHICHISQQRNLCLLIAGRPRGVFCHYMSDLYWLTRGFAVHGSIEIKKSALSNYQEFLRADLVIGADAAYPRPLRWRRCKWDKVGAGVSLAWSMTLMTIELQIIPLEVMGNERRLRTGWSSLNLVIIASSQRTPVESSPKGNRSMDPPQVSPDPLWPLPLVCHLLVWPVQCAVYTWSWHQSSDGQGCRCISYGSTWNNHHRKLNLCRRPWDTRHRGFARLL